MELTILMPCLNEAETLASCIKKAQQFLKANNIEGEILVSDNGSTDGSIEIAKMGGARIVHASKKGYGNALKCGCENAYGKFIIMRDADDSYNFSELMPFLEKLREGYDLVMGNRFWGGIEKGAMPWSHQYIGNPILSFIGRCFFSSKIGDFHCGLRAYNREKMLLLNLQTGGMEYASEMVVKSELSGLKIAEVPTTLSRDGRSRKPHLRSCRDGWRHLKFLFMYAPNWLFLYPGIALLALGILGSFALMGGQMKILNVLFSVHTLLYFMFFIILGMSVIEMFLMAKLYAFNHNFLPHFNTCDWNSNINEDLFIFSGMFLAIAGIAVSVYALICWKYTGYSKLVPESMMRITIPAVTLLATGMQLVFSGFMMGILKNK